MVQKRNAVVALPAFIYFPFVFDLPLLALLVAALGVLLVSPDLVVGEAAALGRTRRVRPLLGLVACTPGGAPRPQDVGRTTAL